MVGCWYAAKSKHSSCCAWQGQELLYDCKQELSYLLVLVVRKHSGPAVAEQVDRLVELVTVLLAQEKCEFLQRGLWQDPCPRFAVGDFLLDQALGAIGF